MPTFQVFLCLEVLPGSRGRLLIDKLRFGSHLLLLRAIFVRPKKRIARWQITPCWFNMAVD